MADEATCGTGMASNAILPTRMAEVMAALADVVTRHTESLDSDEVAGAAESEAWLAIATEHRQLARQLSAAADHMESQQDLPVANHDMSVLTSENAMSALEHYVAAQERLSELLRQQLSEFRTMLDSTSEG